MVSGDLAVPAESALAAVSCLVALCPAAKQGIAHALSNTICAAKTRDAKTGENRANLMWKILERTSMPNLKPHPW